MKSMNPFYLFLRFSLLFYEIKNFAMLKLSALFSLYNYKFSKYSKHLHVYITLLDFYPPDFHSFPQ